MALVIDGSVAFKWFVPEIDRDKALLLLDGDEPLWAPDLVLLEVGNGLFGRLRSIENGLAVAVAAVERLPSIYTRLLPARDFVNDAMRISFELRHPIYDCIYLAMCERHAVEFVTADARLIDRVRGTRHQARVRPL